MIDLILLYISRKMSELKLCLTSLGGGALEQMFVL